MPAVTFFASGGHFAGPLSSDEFYPPASSVKNAAIAKVVGDEIDYDKLEHLTPLVYQLAIVAAAEPLLFIARKAGTIVAIEAALTTAPTDDRTITIDLDKSTGAGAFATALTTPIVLDNTTVVRTPAAGVINSPALLDGDLLQLDIDLAGSVGTQGAGLIVVVWIMEQP